MRLFIELTLFCTLLVAPVVTSACEVTFHASDKLNLCYQTSTKNLEIESRGRTWDIKLFGYSITEPEELTLSEGRVAVAVVDLTGLSAGGEVRIFLFDGESLKQSCSDAGLYANFLLTLDNRRIALMQHVTKNYYEASSILEVSPSGWRQTSDSTAWNLIIKKYKQAYRQNQVNKADYYASMARAYAITRDPKLENYYFDKLREVVPGGSPSTVIAFRHALDYQAAHLKSGKWCLVP